MFDLLLIITSCISMILAVIYVFFKIQDAKMTDTNVSTKEIDIRESLERERDNLERLLEKEKELQMMSMRLEQLIVETSRLKMDRMSLQHSLHKRQIDMHNDDNDDFIYYDNDNKKLS